MKNLVNNKMFWLLIVAATFTMINIVYFGGKIFVDKASNAVIEKLEKEYSPSPYGPGFDPDKVTPDTLRRRALLRDHIENGNNTLLLEEDVAPTFTDSKEWRFAWEEQRGF